MLIGALMSVAVLLTSGCVGQMLTKAVVEAPNRRDVVWVLRPENAAVLAHNDRLYRRAWRVPVGPPAAELAVAVIEPGDYQLVHSIKTGESKHGTAPVWPQSDWRLPDATGSTPVQPKGTVLVLHGYGDSRENMIHWALFLAQQNYRVVLVDLRGHGRSTGDWIGYGAFEASDLRQVIDDLERKDLLVGRLGVLGLSYGASVGLQLAGSDGRVAVVVAIEPFSDPRSAIVEFARATVPQFVGGWSQADFDRTIDNAGRLGHVDWAAADILGAAERTPVPVLYVVAGDDRLISPEHTRRLADRTRSPHAVLEVKFNATGEIPPHVLLAWLLEPAAPLALRWLDEALLRPGPDLGARLEALTVAPAENP
ncbi:MAG TPA: alpha/beta fold hydrolase [Opitutaceae bacterium]|nr:alpha/beta fold hydrolase [Opitutaceae bacterium]